MLRCLAQWMSSAGWRPCFSPARSVLRPCWTIIRSFEEILGLQEMEKKEKKKKKTKKSSELLTAQKHRQVHTSDASAALKLQS